MLGIHLAIIQYLCRDSRIRLLSFRAVRLPFPLENNKVGKVQYLSYWIVRISWWGGASEGLIAQE